MENRVPRRKWCRVRKASNYPALAIEKLTLHSWNAESRQRSDAVRCHPVEHLILNDQAAASSAQHRWCLLVNLNIATQTSQSNTRGYAGNVATDGNYFR